MERRKAVRYQLEIPAVFRWEDLSGMRWEGEGVTRDMSEVGAYVFTTTWPPLKTEVEIKIVVFPLAGAPRAWLKGIMQVLRLEDDPRGGCGFSLVGEAFTLCTEAKE